MLQRLLRVVRGEHLLGLMTECGSELRSLLSLVHLEALNFLCQGITRQLIGDADSFLMHPYFDFLSLRTNFLVSSADRALGPT